MNISLVILSCDKYNDTWEIFWKLKNKYWKDCPYKVYIATENKTCSYFNTIKTQGSWTKRARDTLQKIDTKYVLVMMDDFFIRNKVDQGRLNTIESHFKDNVACFDLQQPYSTQIEESDLEGFKIKSGDCTYKCSCQPALWDRLKLIELLSGDKSPWEWELYTTSPYIHYINSGDLIIDIGFHNKEFSITQGKWSKEIIPFFKSENIDIDYTKRGFYGNEFELSIITPYYKTLKEIKELERVLTPQLNDKVEWIIVDDGCYEKELDLFKAKVIHKDNNGVSSARNDALDIAKGEYIAFIDSDDLIVDNYVSTILKKDKKDYCFMSWKAFNKRNDIVIITDVPPVFNTSVWNCVYKKELIGKYRFNEDVLYGEEIEFNNKVRKGEKTNITDIMYLYNAGREDSLTINFSKGNIQRYKPMKAELVLYLRFVSKIGGVEDFLYEFFKEFKDKYNILFLYREADDGQLLRYKKMVKCRLYQDQQVECSIFLNVNCSENIADNVKADHYYDMVHTDYSAMGWTYTKHKKTELTLCVSKQSMKAFKEQYPKEKAEVFYNLLNLDKPNKALLLITGTRLSWEKGYDRMKILAKRLNELHKSFTWLVFTNDLPNEEIDGFVFRKPCYNVMDYVATADYYVTCSNTEADSMATKKAFQVGVPIIATNYPSIYEQGMEIGKTGYILEMDMSNMDDIIEKMYSKIPVYKPIIRDYAKQWYNLFGKGHPVPYEYKESAIDNEYVEEQSTVYIANQRVKDDKGDVFWKGQEVIYLSPQRVRQLLEYDIIKRKE